MLFVSFQDVWVSFGFTKFFSTRPSVSPFLNMQHVKKVAKPIFWLPLFKIYECNSKYVKNIERVSWEHFSVPSCSAYRNMAFTSLLKKNQNIYLTLLKHAPQFWHFLSCIVSVCLAQSLQTLLYRDCCLHRED